MAYNPQQRTELLKIYPWGEWIIGTVSLPLWFFCIFMSARAGQYGPTVFFLGFALITASLFFLGPTLGVNEHIIVVTRLLTRNQMGWDEVREIEISQNKRVIILYGQDNQKKLVIVGPMGWLGKKKQIGAIFARQIKMRQIHIQEIPVAPFALSSKTTAVSTDSDDPELYVARTPALTAPGIDPLTGQVAPGADFSQIAGSESAVKKTILKSSQAPTSDADLAMGSLGGCLAAILGALVWAGVGYVTGHEFGVVSVGIGLLVGYTAKLIVPNGGVKLGCVSAGMSLAGCILGLILGAIMMTARGSTLGIGGVFFKFISEPVSAFNLYSMSFQIIDVLFFLAAMSTAFGAARSGKKSKRDRI